MTALDAIRAAEQVAPVVPGQWVDAPGEADPNWRRVQVIERHTSRLPRRDSVTFANAAGVRKCGLLVRHADRAKVPA